MESKIETNPTFVNDITPNESSFENVEREDPINPLKDDIKYYLHIEKEKCEIVGPQFDCAHIYDIDKEDEDEIGFPFPLGTIYDDIPVNTPRKENLNFHFLKEGQLEVISFPFKRDPIFNTEEIDKALTSHKYDSMFKSLKPLDYDFGKAKIVEYNASFSLCPICHHLDSSSSDSLTLDHMISSNCDPFPPPEYNVKENPFTVYTFPPWMCPEGFDHSIVSPL